MEVFMGILLRTRPKCICAQGKNGAGSEGENGNIMLLLDAAQELHRSSSGDDGNDIEPSTAGTAGRSQKLHRAFFWQPNLLAQCKPPRLAIFCMQVPITAQYRLCPRSAHSVADLFRAHCCLQSRSAHELDTISSYLKGDITTSMHVSASCGVHCCRWCNQR